VLGYDVVGEIDQRGDGVRDFQLGDRVADMTVSVRTPPFARSGPTTWPACRPLADRASDFLVRVGTSFPAIVNGVQKLMHH
jgi:NADPH:quinone reductase-like Zn-dependent oxidoreductase